MAGSTVGFSKGLSAQVRPRLEVPTTAVAQGAGYAWGAGQKLGTEQWKGATRASTLDGRAWLAAHPDLAFPTVARQVSSPTLAQAVCLQAVGSIMAMLGQHNLHAVLPWETFFTRVVGVDGRLVWCSIMRSMQIRTGCEW